MPKDKTLEQMLYYTIPVNYDGTHPSCGKVIDYVASAIRKFMGEEIEKMIMPDVKNCETNYCDGYNQALSDVKTRLGIK